VSVSLCIRLDTSPVGTGLPLSDWFGMDTLFRTALAKAIGTTVQIGDELAGGGMARVFRARDVALGRDIVIKVLASDVAASVNVERFKREIATAARVQHPQIVPVIATGTVEGAPWYSMPFVAGESLAHRMTSATVDTRWEQLDILRDVARALAAAHQAGVVHRDIKPANVLLASGSAVVTDFGLAQAITGPSVATDHAPRLTLSGTAVGTPAYMAPEQISGDMVDARADVYAWGVLAYELLAGVHPFGDLTVSRDWLVAHLTQTPARITTHLRDLDPGVASLIMHCLAKDPDQRPADGNALLRALDTAVVGHRIAPASRWTGRKVALVTAVATLAAVAVIAWRRDTVQLRARVPAADTPAAPILAVMPFESLGEGADSSFSDGLSEAVTTRLARLAGMRVIDRSSVLTLGTRNDTPRQIGDRLGAQLLLRATVRWARAATGPQRIQVVPTLVRTDDGTTVWVGAAIDAEPGDPFAVQATIASQVVDALDIAIGTAERQRLQRAPTTDAVAWAAFERGHRLQSAYWVGGNVATGRAALDAFRDATTRDPQFADALGAEARLMRLVVRRRHLPPMWNDTVKALARRALALDSTEWAASDVMVQSAVAAGQIDEAYAMVERAIAARPSSAPLQLVRAQVAAASGDASAVHDAVRRALVLAPRDVEVMERAAILEFGALRNATLAESLARRGLVYDSTYLPLWRLALSLALARGDTLAAASIFAAYRARGGPVTSQLFGELRRGDATMRALFRAQNLQTLGAESLPDSLNYFAEKYRAAASNGALTLARAYADSGLRRILDARRPVPTNRDLLRNLVSRAWWQAMAGHAGAADSLLRQAAQQDTGRMRPAGPWIAEVACRRAEIAGTLGRADEAIARMAECLMKPDGYWPPRVLAEPMFARLVDDPRLRALLRANASAQVVRSRL
jgi:eukaryotic-like serine/threonine-protein kinase